MKVRDSGMPDVIYWESLFNVPLILKKMNVTNEIQTLIEVGSGYGTFTIPTSKLIGGKIKAYDIEDYMISFLSDRIAKSDTQNIDLTKCDLLANGFPHADDSIDYVMLFNILHHSAPEEFLKESYRVLRKGGQVGVIHWNFDPTTPRGPAMDIRPKPEELAEKIYAAGFSLSNEKIELPPFHYGWIGIK